MELPTREQVTELAHELWKWRGCPEGTPEEDWWYALEILASPRKSHAPNGSQIMEE